MLEATFVVAVLAGAALAVPYVLHTGRSGRLSLRFGIGLVLAALVYVVFAAVARDAEAVLLEVGGLLLFGLVAAPGVRGSAYWVALGWLAHVAWDLALHPVEHSSYAPWWYPLACVGWDLLVAGYLLAIASRTRAAATGPG